MQLVNTFYSLICFIIALASVYLYAFLSNHTIVFNNKEVNVVIYEFENFETDLVDTVANLCESLSKVFIFSDTFIYPPINLSHISNCHIETIEIQKSPQISYHHLNTHNVLKSRYLLVIADSTRIINSSILSFYIDQLEHHSKSDGFLFPIYSMNKNTASKLACRQFSFDVKRWTVRYDQTGQAQSCEYVHEHGFALLIRTDAWYNLHRPFTRPFIKAFFIQSHIANLSIQLVNEKIFVQGRILFADERLRAKHRQLERYRTIQLYHMLGVKKIHQTNGELEWHGCDRNTPRCFGTIVHDIPEYLIQKRWTPPCCLRNLEITGRYVIDLLDKFAVRYWLEGGSLLGAARNGHIIEWDYDIDIGIYREDSAKLPILSRLLAAESGAQIEDGQGFLWEKALEGDFIKVHYSRTNRIHVDIFPFVAINGTMTKDTWFEDHPQDMPFPEHYLKPLIKVPFIGMEVSAPNNVIQFLEMKFGKGVLQNAKYPRDYDFN